MAPSAFLFGNLIWLAIGLIFAYLVNFAIKLVRHRRLYRDLPSPEHTLVLGNSKILGEWMKRYPADAHPQAMFTDMARHYNFRGIYYIDIYPFGEPMVFITDPSLVAQIQGFARHPFSNSFLRGLVGTKSIFSTQGAEWAAQRAWFSPAFASAHLITLVQGMVEETLVFREKLTQLAIQGSTFQLNDLVLRLAIDVIARSGFDIRLKSQSEKSEVYDAFRSTTEWTAGAMANPFRKFLSPFMMDWYTRKLDKQLEKVIRERYAGKAEDGTSKSILDLAIKGYRKENGKNSTVNNNDELMKIALDNAKTFLIAGHDTTASLVTYAIYLLSQNPEYLARVRQEHDEVFGVGLEKTLESLNKEPVLLNQLSLTLALLKETLRLYPFGFTVRQAPAGATVKFEGREYPLQDHMICNLASAMHRSPEHWESPSEFNPDRFLDPTQHQAAAFLPFEKGPRNCIGQQLSLIEARVIIALTARFFDFTPVLNENGESIEGWGGKAYQELKLAAKPKDGIPMVVKLREA